MLYTQTDHDSLKVELLYGVVLHGWPEDLHFDSPGRFSSPVALEKLLTGWRSGAIRFEKATPSQLRTMAKREGVPVWMLPDCARRVDTGRRKIRGCATRSVRLGNAKQDMKSPRIYYGPGRWNEDRI